MPTGGNMMHVLNNNQMKWLSVNSMEVHVYSGQKVADDKYTHWN